MRLSVTQRAVLACLLAGLTWREAGDLLGCSSANIAYHVRRIRRQYEAWSGEEDETHCLVFSTEELSGDTVDRDAAHTGVSGRR